MRAHAVVYAIVLLSCEPLSRASFSHNRETFAFPFPIGTWREISFRRDGVSKWHAPRGPSRRLTSRRIASCVRPSAPPFSLYLFLRIVDDVVVVVVAIRHPCYGQTTIRTGDGRGGKSPPGEFEEAQAARNARNFVLKKHEIARMSSACSPGDSPGETPR